MPKVTFKIDLEKDIETIFRLANKPSQFGNSKINPRYIEICKGKELNQIKPELAKLLSPTYNSIYPDTFKETIQRLWDKIEPEFFKRMDKLMKKSYSKDVSGYITTLGTCPYDPKDSSFMVSLYRSLQDAMVTTAHEIMHLYFHDFYWEQVEKEIGSKVGDLKEALTVLLNIEFSDLWFKSDSGYEEHKELRKFILDQWKKDKDFQNLLTACISYLKE